MTSLPSTYAPLPWINAIVKMNAAGISPQLIKNYINNSGSRSTLTADDIIYLQGNGVPSDVITAMIEHGSAIASAAAQNQSLLPPPNYAYQQAAQPPVTYQDQTPAPDYYDQYPSQYPYSYGYGYNYRYYPAYPYYGFYGYPTVIVGGLGFYNSGHRSERGREINAGGARILGGTTSHIGGVVGHVGPSLGSLGSGRR